MRVDDWNACGEALSEMGNGAQSLEQVAGRIVTYLYDNLAGFHVDQARRACALVRLYKTHPYGKLPLPLMDLVDAAVGDGATPAGMKCLTLMATVGDEPQWNERTQSVGHQAIPLVSEELLAQIPMVARLVDQFGLDAEAILKPNPDLMLELEQKKYRVFHVETATGSPYIPAQEEFVLRYGIRSVVGFGGLLPSGDLYTVILFSRVPITRTTAEEFASLALSVKISLLPFTFQNVFSYGTF